MLQYNPNLKQIARRLRRETTESERMLWSHLRRRQLLDVQFYRQKPIGNYIVDFYAPKARLVIEVDGSQHLEEIHSENIQFLPDYVFLSHIDHTFKPH